MQTTSLVLVGSVDGENPIENDLRLVVDPVTGAKRFVLSSSLLEVTAQRLRVRLRFFFREWFLDRRLGVPYMRDVLGRKIDAPTILEPMFRQIAQGTPGVATVDRLRLTLGPDRALRVQDLRCRLVTGETLTAADWPPFILGEV